MTSLSNSGLFSASKLVDFEMFQAGDLRLRDLVAVGWFTMRTFTVKTSINVLNKGNPKC